MESEASSSTSSGSNVFGSVRRQKRSSPPLWAEAPGARSAKQRRGSRSACRNPFAGTDLVDNSFEKTRRPFMPSPPHYSIRRLETMSRQRSAEPGEPDATVPHGRKPGLRARGEDFPRRAGARRPPARGFQGSLRSE